MCEHVPSCPDPFAPDHCAARVVATHPEQGWSLLCNGVVLFEDYGELLPSGAALPPRRRSACGHPRAGDRSAAPHAA
jgi:hypothetical protein